MEAESYYGKSEKNVFSASTCMEQASTNGTDHQRSQSGYIAFRDSGFFPMPIQSDGSDTTPAETISAYSVMVESGILE
jgi:hypothetical protein